MPTHYLPFSYIVHLHAERSISEPQEGVTIAAKGGSKLKGREWSSPISNKSLPRKRTERSAAGELIARLPRCREAASGRGAVLESRFATPSHLLRHLHLELFFFLISASLYREFHPGLGGVFFSFSSFFLSCPLPGPQMPPSSQCVSNTNRLPSNSTSKSLSLFRVDFPALRFAHSSENLQEHFLHLQREGSPTGGRGGENQRCRGPGDGVLPARRTSAPRRPRPAAGPATRGQVLKVAVGPNGVPLRPELLPALHQPPPASRPVPTPRSRPPAYRSPCPAGRERGDLPEPPEPVRTSALPPGALLRHSGQVEGRIRERDRGGLRLSFPARPPQRPPPPPAAELEENTAPGRPPRRAGAGLLSSEV